MVMSELDSGAPRNAGQQQEGQPATSFRGTPQYSLKLLSNH